MTIFGFYTFEFLKRDSSFDRNQRKTNRTRWFFEMNQEGYNFMISFLLMKLYVGMLLRLEVFKTKKGFRPNSGFSPDNHFSIKWFVILWAHS